MINSFILANISDVILTAIGLAVFGFIEIGIVAGNMVAFSQISQLLILKTAVTAFMVGIYALSAHHNTRWRSSVETALKIGTVLVWVVVAWNELNIALALGQLL